MLRVNWNYIKIALLLGVVVFLYAFSSGKNAQRKIAELDIQFVGDNNLFITTETVSKLLIQKNESVTNVPKEILDLNGLENALNSNPIIKKAEVYVSVDAKLTARIEQKRPIARVSTNASYYIDEDGSYMPLSSNYSARVPFVTGIIEKNSLSNVFKVADKVYKDEFLKKNVIEIHQNKDKTVYLKLRQNSFQVDLGKVASLDKKVSNLKVFYQKALKDKTLNSYSKVNLQFDNQVVCTKK